MHHARILHLVDDSHGEVWPVTLACIQRLMHLLPEARHEVQLIGHDRLRIWATDQDFPVCQAHPSLKLTQLKAWKLKKELDFSPQFTAVHTWSNAALQLARRCFRLTPVYHHLLRPPHSMQEWKGLEYCVTRLHLMTLVTASHEMQLQLQRHLPEAKTLHCPITPMCPVPPSRQSIRQQWQVDDQTSVIMVIADPPESGSTLIAGWITALAQFAGNQVRLLMYPEMDPNRRTLKAMESMGMDVLIRDDLAQFPWKVLPGVDVGVVLGQETEEVQWNASIEITDDSAVGIGPTLRLAEHLGLPMVMEEGNCQQERFAPEEHLLTCPPSRPRLLARQIHRLINSPQLCDQLSSTLRQRIQEEDSDPKWADHFKLNRNNGALESIEN